MLIFIDVLGSGWDLKFLRFHFTLYKPRGIGSDKTNSKKAVFCSVYVN